MNILYIGRKETYVYYKKGLNPSHWLYGAVQMENDGHLIFWEEENKTFFNDLRILTGKSIDMIFIPNLNLHNHLLLLTLSSLHILRTPVYAFLHHEPKEKHGFKSYLYKFLLHGCKHVFFLSQRSMDETVAADMLGKDQCSVPGWGPDMEFYSSFPKSDNGFFVSTGKENRDFDILIDAFQRTGLPLKIITSKSHAGNNYEDLPDKCKGIKNIEIIITENSGEVYPMMVKEMANARALVCPLRTDRLNYCVGLSTILDAEGLQKPLVITRNPYHDEERMKKFNVVESVEDWVDSLENLKKTNESDTIEVCYEKMKPIMGL